MRINQGCNKIRESTARPIHQKKRLSSTENPINTHQATQVVIRYATDKA